MVESLYIYIYSLLVWVITAEPIGPNFFLGSYMIPGKVYGRMEFQNLPTKNLDFSKSTTKIDERLQLIINDGDG